MKKWLLTLLYIVPLGVQAQRVQLVVSGTPVTIQPGASEQVALRTSVGDIVDFNGIVLTCKRDGSDYENVNVPSWYNTAYIGKTAVCD